jgi:hypothetical protein
MRFWSELIVQRTHGWRTAEEGRRLASGTILYAPFDPAQCHERAMYSMCDCGMRLCTHVRKM